MKKIATAFLASAAGLAFGLSSAVAADIPARQAYKAPVMVAPAFSWTGFYIGANVGYGWASGSGIITVAGAGTGPTSGRGDGILGGAQIGYNWQTGPWVFGVETDIQASDGKGTVTAFPGAAVMTATAKNTYFGTIRGRVGYAWDRTMVYATGGGMYGENTLNGTITTSGAFSSSQTYWTYVVGGGVEHMFMPNWSAKLEYLYAGPPDSVPAPPNTTALTGDSRGHIVRAGINYHF